MRTALGLLLAVALALLYVNYHSAPALGEGEEGRLVICTDTYPFYVVIISNDFKLTAKVKQPCYTLGLPSGQYRVIAFTRVKGELVSACALVSVPGAVNLSLRRSAPCRTEGLPVETLRIKGEPVTVVLCDEQLFVVEGELVSTEYGIPTEAVRAVVSQRRPRAPPPLVVVMLALVAASAAYLAAHRKVAGHGEGEW